MIYCYFIDFFTLLVGQHWYWKIMQYSLHGQVIATILFVLIIINIFSSLCSQDCNTIPYELQNITEYVIEFIQNLVKIQIGFSYYFEWVSFVGTIFLFILVSNWSGALIPWNIFQIPNGELAAPTNDINTTTALALLTSFTYFYRGFRKSGLYYFQRYFLPTIFLFPINMLEDFTKPLSLSFRLFGNILADELVVKVLLTLIPLVIPIPLMLLGIFTSGIQALVFATLTRAYIGETMEKYNLLAKNVRLR